MEKHIKKNKAVFAFLSLSFYAWSADTGQLALKSLENHHYIKQLIGGRKTQEDTPATYFPKGLACFAVFDGFGGSGFSEKLSKEFFRKFDTYLNDNQSNIKEAMQKTYTNDLFEKDVKDGSGSTAVTAIISLDEKGNPVLNIGWAGDSRAFVADDTLKVIMETNDHTPDNENERKKIEENGVTCKPDQMYPDKWRVCNNDGIPVLSVARGFGGKKYGVKPEVEFANELLLTKKHKWLILGSDGLFQKEVAYSVSSQELAQRLKGELDDKDNCGDIEEIVQQFAQASLKHGNDNITAVVVDLAQIWENI